MSEDRLTQIETILLRVAQQQETAQKLIESNARSIEANSNAIAELRRSQEASLTEFRESMSDTVNMIGTLAQSADEDRQLIRGLQTQSNRILEHLFGREEGQA